MKTYNTNLKIPTTTDLLVKKQQKSNRQIRLRWGANLSPSFKYFMQFCLVGCSGVLVDMAVLYVLVNPSLIGFEPVISKVISAEVALLNNFVWNETWTFREKKRDSQNSVSTRLITFNVICGTGIFFSAGFIYLFHEWLGWNLYLSNFISITLVTCWNFGINSRFNWKIARHKNTAENIDNLL